MEDYSQCIQIWCIDTATTFVLHIPDSDKEKIHA